MKELVEAVFSGVIAVTIMLGVVGYWLAAIDDTLKKIWRNQR